MAMATATEISALLNHILRNSEDKSALLSQPHSRGGYSCRCAQGSSLSERGDVRTNVGRSRQPGLLGPARTAASVMDRVRPSQHSVSVGLTNIDPRGTSRPLMHGPMAHTADLSARAGIKLDCRID